MGCLLLLPLWNQCLPPRAEVAEAMAHLAFCVRPNEARAWRRVAAAPAAPGAAAIPPTTTSGCQVGVAELVRLREEG
jgi:hypothetical protein